MGRIADIFAQARATDSAVLMPFVVGGYPSIDATEMLLAGIDEAGAGIVEIGIPFSDPIADGPVIAGAMHDALEAGICVDSVLETVARARPHTQAGLIAMVSHSIVHRLGDDQFIRRLAEIGFDGIIVPDIDVGVADSLVPVVDELDLAMAMLIAPTTTDERLQVLLERCRGFVYMLARTGLTGAPAELTGLEARVRAVRKYSDLPIAVGFGIATPEQVAQATKACDAAIVGSALVHRMAGSSTPSDDALATIEALATGLERR